MIPDAVRSGLVVGACPGSARLASCCCQLRRRPVPRNITPVPQRTDRRRRCRRPSPRRPEPLRCRSAGRYRPSPRAAADRADRSPAGRGTARGEAPVRPHRPGATPDGRRPRGPRPARSATRRRGAGQRGDVDDEASRLPDDFADARRAPDDQQPVPARTAADTGLTPLCVARPPGHERDRGAPALGSTGRVLALRARRDLGHPLRAMVPSPAPDPRPLGTTRCGRCRHGGRTPCAVSWRPKVAGGDARFPVFRRQIAAQAISLAASGEAGPGDAVPCDPGRCAWRSAPRSGIAGMARGVGLRCWRSRRDRDRWRGSGDRPSRVPPARGRGRQWPAGSRRARSA